MHIGFTGVESSYVTRLPLFLFHVAVLSCMLLCNYIMLTNKIHFLNCFNSILEFYMFQTSYVHLQEDYGFVMFMFISSFTKNSPEGKEQSVWYNICT
jgi:hypothetical protein